MSRKSNAEVEKEQKKVELRPEDLKDTDAEDEFKESGGKGFRQQFGTDQTKSTLERREEENSKRNGGGGSSSSSAAGGGGGDNDNKKWEKDQKQIEHSPGELKDTDVDDEFKEQD